MKLPISSHERDALDAHTSHYKQKSNKAHSPSSLLKRFYISLACTVPILFYGGPLSFVFNISEQHIPLASSVHLIFGTIIFLYGGSIFLNGAFQELKKWTPGMMTLIAIAICSAYFWSLFASFGNLETLFWELATLIDIMLIGHYLERRAIHSAERALTDLSQFIPDVAEVKRGDTIITTPVTSLQVNDLVLVRPGAKVPADGSIVQGSSEINESMITGESQPVPKHTGDNVFAGTINSDGVLTVQVTKIGEHTFLSGIMQLIAEAQLSKSNLQTLSDKAAFYLTIIAIVSSGLTLSTWLYLGESMTYAVSRTVAVLVVACPHALGLAVPLVASISTTMAARAGFLVRKRLALESARLTQTVVFDKTGTLTEGTFKVTGIFTDGETPENKLLQTAASIDFTSEHPIAKAIVTEALKRDIHIEPAKEFSLKKGMGARAKVNDTDMIIGNRAFLEGTNVQIPKTIQAALTAQTGTGQTSILIGTTEKALGFITLMDTPRESAKNAVEALNAMRIKTIMVTGDSEDVAKRIRKDLNISEYRAEVLPEQKSSIIESLQNQGAHVLMVGDGINDAPALARADAGIAIGAGTDLAIESAGIILIRNDPQDIPKIIRLSRATYKKMMQNLFWATGYNIITIPLAAGALASKGIILEPSLSAAFMSASTIIVALNALLLRKVAI